VQKRNVWGELFGGVWRNVRVVSCLGKFSRANFPGKKCQAVTCRKNVRILTQDYKSVRLEVMICAALVNTQSHRQRFTGCNVILSAQPAQLKDVER